LGSKVFARNFFFFFWSLLACWEYNIHVSEFIADAIFQFPDRNIRGGLTLHREHEGGKLIMLEVDKSVTNRLDDSGCGQEAEIMDVLVPVPDIDGEDLMQMDSPVYQRGMDIGQFIVVNEPKSKINLS